MKLFRFDNKKLIPLLVTLVLGVLLIGALGLRHWYNLNLGAPSAQETAPVLLRIESGTSSSQIAALLAGDGLIKSKLAFEWYLFRHGLTGDLKAGLYRLHRGQTAVEVAGLITNGSNASRTVVIAGGMELSQIKATLVAAGYRRADIEAALKAHYPYSIVGSKPKAATLEGYLFPDTYQLEIDQPVRAMIDLMLSNTDQKITPDIREGWRAQGLNLHQGLTLASIVQRETSDPSDQQQVAQVFLKRLRIGKPLESDPTFLFAAKLLGQTPSVHIDSPYNTYLHVGLPPTPLCTIELAAAEAVAHPAATDWLYFLADKSGHTHFAATEEGHKRNIAKYLH